MIIYKTTNLINGKIYVGKDTNDNPNYLGSGIILKNAIKKYGIQNFKKEILENCNTIKDLNEREKYWIKKYNTLDKQIGYNISLGGDGGDLFSNNPNKENIRKKYIKANKNKCIGMRRSDESKQKMKLNHADFNGKGNPFYGKTHAEKTIKKIKIIQSNRNWNNKISKSIKEKINGMNGEERKKFLGRNFNQNKTNEARRGIKMWSKSDVIKEKFGKIIFNLYREGKSYSEISRSISTNQNIGWWIIKTIIKENYVNQNDFNNGKINK
jgi:group I intron endonuclease